MGPTLSKIEDNLLAQWKRVLLANEACDFMTRLEAENSLSHGISYLFNYCLDHSSQRSTWREYGSDDLLDAEYSLGPDDSLIGKGLMIWGPLEDTCANLSPFVGQLWRQGEEMCDFCLKFSESTPDGASCTIPYTRDAAARSNLLRKIADAEFVWPMSIRRSEVVASTIDK